MGVGNQNHQWWELVITLQKIEDVGRVEESMEKLGGLKQEKGK